MSLLVTLGFNIIYASSRNAHNHRKALFGKFVFDKKGNLLIVRPESNTLRFYALSQDCVVFVEILLLCL